MDQNNSSRYGEPNQPQAETRSQVPPSAQPNLEPPLYNSAASRPKKSITGIIVALVVLFLVGIGSVGAYYAFFNALTPELVFVRAVLSYKDVTSFEYKASLEGEINTPPSPGFPFRTFSYDITSNGKVDLKDLQNPAMDLSFDTVVNSSDNKAKTKATADIDFIGKDKVGYIRFNTLDLSYSTSNKNDEMAQVATYFKGAVKNILNKWIKFDMTSQDKKETEDPNPEESLTDLTQSIERLEDENIGGIDMYHYRFNFDNAKVKESFDSFQKAQVSFLENNLVAAVFNTQNKTTGTTTPVEIWIGKKDFHIYRVTSETITYGQDDDGSYIKVKGTIDVSNYNKQVTISVPTSSITAEEAAAQIMGPLLNSTMIVPAPQPVNKQGR